MRVAMPLDLVNLPDATIVHAWRADSYTSGSWPDRVGSLDLSEATNPPTAVADGGSDFNNQPVVRLNGTNQFLSGGTITVTQPFTILAVAKLTLNNATFKRLVHFGPALMWTSGEQVELRSGTGGNFNSASSSLDAVHLFEGYFDGASSFIRTDSVPDATGNPGAGGASGATLYVGQLGGSSQWWGGDVAEIIIVSGGLTHRDRAYLAQYVNQRYGFAFPFPQTQAPTETAFSSATQSHNINIPAVEAGEAVRIGMIFNSTTSSIDLSPPDGTWREVFNSSPGAIAFGVYAKKFDSPQAATTVNFATSTNATGAAHAHKVSLWGGDIENDIEIDVTSDSTSTPNPPELTASWGALRNLWFAHLQANDDDATVSDYPDGYNDTDYVVSGAGVNAGCTVASCWRHSEAASENPTTFALSDNEGTGAFTEAWRPLKPPPTGSGAASLGAVSQQGIGAEAFAATGAQTLGAAHQQGVAVEEFTGMGSQILGHVSQAGDATHTLPPGAGAGAQALGAVSQAASGDETFAGAAAQTLGSVTQAAAGSLETSGAAAQALGPVSQAAAAEQGFEAAGAQALGPVSQQASGAESMDAVGAQVLGPASQAGSGAEEIGGTGAQSLAPVQQAGAGSLEAAGTAAQTLSPVSQAAAAQEEFIGLGVQTLGPVSQAAAGSQGEGANGVGAQTLAPPSQAGVGVENMQASGAQTLGAVTQEGVGVSDVYGAGAQVLGPVSQRGIGDGGTPLAVALHRMRGFMKNVGRLMGT